MGDSYPAGVDPAGGHFMPWRTTPVVEQREEFVRLASVPGTNKSALCRRFGISRKTGYKWLERSAAEGVAGLGDRSRRPHRSPERTPSRTERKILRIRGESNNAWGGRKIAHVMVNDGWGGVPAPSTITEILRRNGKLAQKARQHPGPWQRFERPAPNDLWQMDFKGHFAVGASRCHPLTVLDDHSRYALALDACSNEQDRTVRERLTQAFRRYGMPLQMLMDNGSPWGDDRDNPFTVFTAWLLQLGVGVSHGRPFHPQTQGKDERLHRTLNAEVLTNKQFADLGEIQSAFDKWRHKYNHRRPHQALDMNVPASRYRVSPRTFPERLPEIVYDEGDEVRKVDVLGKISFKNRTWRISKAFRGKRVALRPTEDDGVMAVFFCTHRIGRIDLRNPARRLVDLARATPTTPQAQQQQNRD
jgi:transposase InsO family protein